MPKLIKLTDKQIAKFPEYVKKWTEIGLSCKPCDFDKAKAAAIKCYELAGLQPPKLFFMADSPLSGAVMAAILKDQVRAQVVDQVRAQVWDQVRAQVRDQVWDQVRDQVGDQVGDQVRLKSTVFTKPDGFRSTTSSDANAVLVNTPTNLLDL